MVSRGQRDRAPTIKPATPGQNERKTPEMMKNEFEALAGYEVTAADYYGIIEPMYNATPASVSKADFVKMIDRHAFALPTAAELLRQMRKDARQLRETCGRYYDGETLQRVHDTARQYAKRRGYDTERDGYFYDIVTEYEYPETRRGCTYPKALVLGRNWHEYERIELA